jgi:hypothetical protein
MPNRIDRNADSLDRIRRNFQRLSQGAANFTIVKSSDAGLEIDASGGVSIKLDGTSLTLSEAGLKVTNTLATNEVPAQQQVELLQAVLKELTAIRIGLSQEIEDMPDPDKDIQLEESDDVA